MVVKWIFRFAAGFAGALLVIGMLLAQQKHQEPSKRGVMKTRAGEILVGLPDDWMDSTEYVYFSQDEKSSLRISQILVDSSATTRNLLNSRLQKLTAIGDVKRLAEDEMQVKGRAASYSHVEVTPIPQSAQPGRLGIRALVVRVDKGKAIAAILTGPADQQAKLAQTWETFIHNLSFIDNP